MMLMGLHERRDWFVPLLVISAAAHFLVISFWKLSSRPQPHFSIQQAASSVEVRLVREQIRPVAPPVVQPEQEITPQSIVPLEISKTKVLAQENSVEEIPQDPVKKEEVPPVESTPELQGALVEAVPLERVNQPPVYPITARRKGWEGTVQIRVHVDSSGEPLTVTIEKTSGYGELDQAALRAVKRWQFTPAQQHGKSVTSWVTVPVRFQLTN